MTSFASDQLSTPGIAAQLLRTAFERSPTATAIIGPDLKLITANDAFAQLIGVPCQQLAGVHLHDITCPQDVADDHVQIARLLAGAAESYAAQRRYVRRDDEQVRAAVDVHVARDAGGASSCLVLHAVDLTARSTRQLAPAMRCDALTVLPSRAGGAGRLGQLLAGAGPGERAPAVIVLGVDDLAVVSDALGAHAADDALVQLAERLATLTAPDTFARVGADTFALLCRPGADELEVLTLARTLIGALRAPITLSDGEPHVLTVSAGVALADDQANADMLLSDAAAALADARTRGREQLAVFDARLHQRARARLDVERALRRALAHEDFEVHFQPRVALSSGAVVGAEALVRWRQDGALVGPGAFIDVAERTGLIDTLGAWVLEQAFMCAAAWPEHLTVSVNLSPGQLRTGELAAHVSAQLARYQLDAARVCLEVTESAVVDADAAAVLDELAALGVSLAIDDFGTGYSSFAQLASMPVDELKVDRSLVSGLDDGRGRAIVSAMVALADALDLCVVAEGVERPEQVAALAELGCGVAQGFLWAPALPADEFRALAAARAPQLGLDTPRDAPH